MNKVETSKWQSLNLDATYSDFNMHNGMSPIKQRTDYLHNRLNTMDQAITERGKAKYAEMDNLIDTLNSKIEHANDAAEKKFTLLKEQISELDSSHSDIVDKREERADAIERELHDFQTEAGNEISDLRRGRKEFELRI